MFLMTLAQIVGVLANALVMLVIVQFVIGLLFSFNVISARQGFMMQLYNAIGMLLDPILRPIRRILPNTGAIDFSPIVLILGLTILQTILQNLAMSYG